MTTTLGRLGRLHVSDDAGANFVLVGCLVDGSLTAAVDEIEDTCRENGSSRTWKPNFSDGSIDGTFNWDDSDEGQQKMKAAFWGKTAVRARWRMEEVSGADEFESEAFVTAFTINSPRDDLATVDFTLRLSGDFSPSAQP